MQPIDSPLRTPNLPEPMNQAFCDWLGSKVAVHPLMAMEINRYIRKEFGQFNERSAIQEESRPQFSLAYLYSEHGAYGPEERQVIKKPGMKARAWRTLGILFSKPEWIRRGVNYRFVKVAGASFSRTVRMISVGYNSYPDPFRNPTLNFSIRVGYEPLTDTLYVDPRVLIAEDFPYGR